MKTKTNKKSLVNQEKLIGVTLKKGGFVFPTSVKELDEFEIIYGRTDVILPKELENPSFLYASNKLRTLKVIEKCNYKVAMAAREGFENLPDDILSKMENDRRKADNKTKK